MPFGGTVCCRSEYSGERAFGPIGGLDDEGGQGMITETQASPVGSGDVSSEPMSRALRMVYRPHIDGLRAVAVFLVVAFHAGLGILPNGFVGVDVFFVLSGFLVTSILLRDLVTSGRVSWRRFYARRVRRILPAAFVVLIVTALVYAVVATPGEMLDAMGGFRAAFLYGANWYFIRQATDYFATNVNSNPVLHFWSLAVEEQFYLAWPLVFGSLYAIAVRFGRRRWWVLRLAVAGVAVASAVEALHIAAHNLDRAYFGTDTRAYQLLAGAVLALTPQLFRVGRRGATALRRLAPVFIAALLLLATSAIDVSAITRGILVAVVASVLIVALDDARGGFTRRSLSSAPLAYLGRISYGIYLWHFPVVVLLTRNHSVAPLRLFLLVAPISTVLGALSFHVVEHPIRVSRLLDRYKTPVVAIGMTSSILAGIFVIPPILDTGSHLIAQSPGGKPGSTTLLDWRDAKKDRGTVPDCLGAAVQRCTTVHGHGLHVLLLGDSVAQMWASAFTELAQRESLTLSITALWGCPWQRGVQFADPIGGQASQRRCKAHQDDWYRRVIPQLRPDVIVIAPRSYDDPVNSWAMVPLIAPNGDLIRRGAPGSEQTLADLSSSSLRDLHRFARRVVILEPGPIPSTVKEPITCLSAGEVPAKCTFVASPGPAPMELYFRALAKSDHSISTLDLDRVVCPRLPTCDSVIDNIIVWRAGVHITATFARSRWARIDALLHAEGVLPAR